MSNFFRDDSSLDPRLREKLLRESSNPLRGFRRVLWIAFFGSAAIGLIIMSLKSFTGDTARVGDIGIQLAALLLFGGLLWIDRTRL